MDRCKHVGRLRLAPDHSILNPQKWHCVDCNTSESIWACLGCAHVACGRYIEEHALQHFKEQRHPLAMEVNELYVFCYLCDDYVLNDNATGDLKLLRSTLAAIQSQRYEVTTRSGRTLRSAGEAPTPRGASELQLRDEDRMFTALWHRRLALAARVFRLWFGLTGRGRARQEEERRRAEAEERKLEARERRRALKRQLREQLEHAPLRKSLRLRRRTRRASEGAGAAAMPEKTKTPPAPLARRSRTASAPTPKKNARRKNARAESKSPSSGGKPKREPPRQSAGRQKRAAEEGGSPFKRRPAVTPGVTGLRNLGNTCYMNSVLQVLSHLRGFRECFLRLDLAQTPELLASAARGRPAGEAPPRRSPAGAGLSGGASRGGSMELIQAKEPGSKRVSLCHELRTLFRVMWSGKWALVSPFAMLHSVWQLIPTFRGYAQQDAQEFLCELLDKVQRELESTAARAAHKRLVKQVLGVVNTIFRGQLLSQVTCVSCERRSDTVESFWDLSLEFPERYHSNGARDSAAQTSCHLTEMLAKFTETEALEGDIYACDYCNSTRRRPLSKVVVLTPAQKQLTVRKMPQVLRLHLKRFRWSGRNHREKIGVHVSFDQLLDMDPYCCGEPGRYLYELSAVVMHHGKGFGSGHYTAYCYNSAGGFWVHCNDSKMNVCSVDEVCRAQAYILFYTQTVARGKDRPP
ncbi:ubiquitin carboxyl-terminal hydrolase 44 [Corythoichthys intestinalis]|uniref:ubiquitin carboxyl-terminal hydrolase 44 n=1 Tax=Corythoichthys intestinalis TaxID=161448 RepID=UPI0025A66898|nr:ubiquitin carboxyl-terminal hydrolase 44 [Corythoichthys intestinalis]XP_057710640.1 ubiquitin carboxyl-terminal hydrolase 44 [Corythoichthys intestinalis]XP_057710641.1 ubiquitin carboxyl-terminal hydrolase 44 [Corythoichthys intestinalis]XP_057710642.1 ubiquitin carboxyl-terminal hydrolase 44 [Corythoichthys intestinalis]XP_057710643.1 ubiquitin carboxyl-terminal hydrolase 44 [Corythoichthys intestinalis]XP_057710644.1 ubiquitin carboxyl-terminal hydrolase 44 [Corythoichthys intestinalis]